MQRLLGPGIGTWLVLGLLATVLFHEAPVAQARVVSEAAVAAGGFDCVDVTQIPQNECEALVTFFYATGGDGWDNNAGWLATNTPCDWYGIGCDAGHVVVVDMEEDNYLDGSIPPEIIDLSKLKVLVASGNGLHGGGLSGVLPPEISALTHLETLAIQHDGSDTLIPAEIGDLPNLKSFFMGHRVYLNESSTGQSEKNWGELPPEIGNLTTLQELGLSNSIAGSIPPELGDLPNLVYLSLHGNDLPGSIPPELGNLTSLQYLSLTHDIHLCSGPYGNPFPTLSGEVPPELGNLINLEVFHLTCQDDLTGPLPMTLTNLLQMTSLGYFGAGVCEPTDPTFQDWIAGIPHVSPSPGILCEPSSQQLYLPLVAR